MEFLQPNKTDSLPFLTGQTAEPPARNAKATIMFRASEEPYIREFIVGPLPVVEGLTTIAPLDYVFNKGKGIQRVYDADDDKVREYSQALSKEIEDILLDLFNATASGKETDSMYTWGIDPLWHENGLVVTWQQYWNSPTDLFDSGTHLPLGLYFKLDITGRNPELWSVLGWYYNGIFYDSTEAFRAAWSSPDFEKLGLNIDNPRSHTDWTGEILEFDENPGPVTIKPGPPRYKVDTKEQYVQWSKSLRMKI